MSGEDLTALGLVEVAARIRDGALSSVEVTRALAVAVSLDLGSQRVEIINFGSAHTDSDVVIFVPTASTVFVGDLLEEGADPQFDEKTALGNWPTKRVAWPSEPLPSLRLSRPLPCGGGRPQGIA